MGDGRTVEPHVLPTDQPVSELRRLRAGLTVLIGVEPIIALVDVGGYEKPTVLDTPQWAAEGLTENTIRVHCPSATPPDHTAQP